MQNMQVYKFKIVYTTHVLWTFKNFEIYKTFDTI